MTTSVQVGFFCYQPGAAASTAACAAVVPRFDTVGNDVVYLACSGIDSSNKLLMQTTTARRDGLTPPIISTVAISPLFSDCMWTESIAAGETLLSAVILVFVPIWTISKIIKILKWGRGEVVS